MRAICDSSALIALDQIGSVWLLKSLFDEVLVTPAVVRETSVSVRMPDWIRTHDPPQLTSRVLRRNLDAGESEVIALALEMEPDFVVLDDKAARRLATGFGLPVVGTIGLLMRAREKGLIGKLRPLLDRLRECSFHISASLYEIALRAAGEAE